MISAWLGKLVCLNKKRHEPEDAHSPRSGYACRICGFSWGKFKTSREGSVKEMPRTSCKAAKSAKAIVSFLKTAIKMMFCQIERDRKK